MTSLLVPPGTPSWLGPRRLLAARHALFLGLSLLFASRFFPLLHPTTHCMTTGDAGLMCWTLQWVSHSLVHDPLGLFRGNIFYPYPHAVTLTDAMLPLGAANVAVRLFTDNPWVGYNLLIVLAYYLSALSGAWLAEEVTGSRLAGLWGGIFWGFLFFRVHHIGHLQILSFQGIPAAIVCLVRYWRQPGTRTALAFAAVFVAQVLVSWYLAVILAVTLAVVAAVRPAAARLRLDHVRYGLLVLLVSMSIVPFALPYARAFGDSSLAARKSGAVDVTDAVRPADYLTPPNATLAGRRIPNNRYWIWQENTLYVGYAAIALAACGLVALRKRDDARRWAVAGILLIVVGYLFALGFTSRQFGAHLPLYYLSRMWPFFTGLRATQRFSLVIYAGILVLSALGLAAIVRNGRRAWSGPAWTSVFCALFLLEVFPFYLPFAPMAPWTVSQPDRAIARIQKGLDRPLVVLHLPIYYLVESYPVSESGYMVNSTAHWARLVNGFSGGEPDGFMERMRLLATLPEPDAVAELRRLGVDVVAVHAAETRERRERLIAYFSAQPGATIVPVNAQEFLLLLSR